MKNKLLKILICGLNLWGWRLLLAMSWPTPYIVSFCILLIAANFILYIKEIGDLIVGV